MRGAQCRRLLVRVARGAKNDGKLEHGQELVGLAIWQIHFGLGIESQTLRDVANDADDFHPRDLRLRCSADLHALAERVFAGEIGFRHGRIDEDNGRGFFFVGGSD